MTVKAQVLSKQLVMINGFLMDVSLHEEHQFENEITEYPVESGGNVVDNIRPKPIEITMECLVSNTPINQDIISARSAVSEPADDAYAMLQKVRDDREPVTIRTSLATYENMALQSLSIPRETGRGDELRFTATFKQIITVQNVRSTRVSVPAAQGSKTLTKSPTTDNSVGPQPTGMFRIIRVNGLYYWFDDRINGWRQSASYSTRKDPNNINSGTDLNTHAWAMHRGPPYGIGDQQWANAKINIPNKDANDDYWNTYLIDIRGIHESTGAPDPTNPFDPTAPKVGDFLIEPGARID